jgi:hypothetical protein
MKTTRLFIIITSIAFATVARAANVTVYDSVVSLATNLTENYTFTDSSSGQSVVIAVTMSPYSSITNSASFSLLDNNGVNDSATRVGVDSGTGSGDGNLISSGEGVNFSASLVSASSGVQKSSIQFRIAGLGVRPVDGGGSLTWNSSVTASTNISYSSSTEVIQTLDATSVSLNGATYSGQLTNNSGSAFQLTDVPAPGQSVVLNATFTATNLLADPRTNSWFTVNAGKYARIYTNDISRTNGISLTMWTNGSTIQMLPVYCGVQEVYSSSNWVYIRSTGLGSFVMGPWYLNAQHTQAFPNWPTNQKTLYRIPRSPSVPTTKTANGGGPIGYFVDGAAMFNSWDAYSYSTVSNVDAQNITGYWNRDAYVNEGASFDPNNAHQAGGQYHYHANPPALRYQLGDHIDFNSVTKIYTESTNTPTKHSPILAWTADGYPVYGPYGYSVSNDASSGIRRMISGFVLRNGQYGTSNLTANGRKTIPAWSARLFNVSSNQVGPNVSTSFPLGRYMEDNDYLGDHGIAPGTNTYDLDEYNGRWCVTPEFPQGTYAYFVSISSNGTPTFPYNIGRGFYGSPTGGTVTGITETVVTNFLGNTNLTPTLNSPNVNNGKVTLTWSAIEGGTYMVQSTTNFSTWTTNSTTVPAILNAASYTNNPTDNYRFYRVARTAAANFDSAGTTTFSTTSVAPGGSASRGQTVTVTITLPSSPPNPPANAPITSVVLGGSITSTSNTDATAGTVVATFTIPSNATTGAQNIVVTFQSGPAYTISSFTIN